MAYLDSNQLASLGLKSFGQDVKISEWARLYNPANIIIGNNVRIDDFCILSAGDGGIELGSHIHIGAYSSIIGNELIVISDYCGLSSRVSIYSSSDDYSGQYLTNPVVPGYLTNVKHAPVQIAPHCIIGCGSVILPGVMIQKGVAVGALSLVRSQLEEFNIYSGNPLRKISARSRELINLEAQHTYPSGGKE
jgi:galactoside O-acetyltransferase